MSDVFMGEEKQERERFTDYPMSMVPSTTTRMAGPRGSEAFDIMRHNEERRRARIMEMLRNYEKQLDRIQEKIDFEDWDPSDLRKIERIHDEVLSAYSQFLKYSSAPVKKATEDLVERSLIMYRNVFRFLDAKETRGGIGTLTFGTLPPGELDRRRAELQRRGVPMSSFTMERFEPAGNDYPSDTSAGKATELKHAIKESAAYRQLRRARSFSKTRDYERMEESLREAALLLDEMPFSVAVGALLHHAILSQNDAMVYESTMDRLSPRLRKEMMSPKFTAAMADIEREYLAVQRRGRGMMY